MLLYRVQYTNPPYSSLRSSQLFQTPGVESTMVTSSLGGSVPKFGFFANGVFCSIDNNALEETSAFGSAGLHVVIGPRSGRGAWRSKNNEGEASEGETDMKMQQSRREKAPRDENNELVIKRREIQAGRAIAVSTIEWSVAEKTAKPTSQLEQFMWEKETEVDRLRERNPLANVLSNCKAYMMDPGNAKTRDWIGAIRGQVEKEKDNFLVIPECKRSEPNVGSLRKRYVVKKLAEEYSAGGAVAISVNSDGIMFGGSLEDITMAKEACPEVRGGGGSVATTLYCIALKLTTFCSSLRSSTSLIAATDPRFGPCPLPVPALLAEDGRGGCYQPGRRSVFRKRPSLHGEDCEKFGLWGHRHCEQQGPGREG